MVKLTCLLKRKEGLTPAEFRTHWVDVHGPLVANSKSGSHVVRYEQNPRPADDYRSDDDRSGYDGVTVQWFPSMAEYHAHMREDDFPSIMDDIATFLDVDHLELILTEQPLVVMDGEPDWS
jgi:uncharacterized protein (TIGR02118 family)